MAFHKDAVTFSSIITCSLLSPAFARRHIPAPPRRKRSAGKISQELHHGPRGTCSSGGESRASRSVDTNPHHKNVLVEGGGAATARDFILQGDYFPPGSLGTRGGDGQTDVLLGGQTGRV